MDHQTCTNYIEIENEGFSYSPKHRPRPFSLSSSHPPPSQFSQTRVANPPMHPFFFTILVVSLYSVAPLVVKLPSSKRTNKSNCRLDGETIQHSKSKISDSNPFLSPNDVEYKSQHDTLYNFLDGPLIFVKDPKRTLSQLSSRRGSLSLLSASLATILTPSPTLASGPPPKRIPVSTSSPPVPSQPSLKFLTSPLNIRTGEIERGLDVDWI